MCAVTTMGSNSGVNSDPGDCNVELMWLTGRLAPDFKTIADFRKDNGPARMVLPTAWGQVAPNVTYVAPRARKT